MKLRSLICSCLFGLVLVLLTGCPSEVPPPSKKKVHSHPDKGIHGGPIAEWGEEEYHPELVLDKEKKTATVYILDGEVEKLVPIEAKIIKLTLKSESPVVTVELKAEPQKDEPAGKSSKFVATHEKFGTDLDPDMIVVSGKIGDKEYEKEFKHHEDED